MISSPIMRCAYVAFGANLGDVEWTYAKVKSRLEGLSEGRQVRASRLWRTHPVGGPADQPNYFNGCFEILGGPPHDVLFDRLMELERQFGRTRSDHWAARTIDLDLLLANEFVARRDIDVPHPRLHHRRFVLEPLVELSTQVVHPWLLRTAVEMLALVRAPDPTFVIFSGHPELTLATQSRIHDRLPQASFVEYPLDAGRPAFLPAQKRTIATVGSLAMLDPPIVDIGKCWGMILSDVDYAAGTAKPSEPLPTYDARADTVEEVLSHVDVFLDSLGIDWIEA